jgi:hypothetical protein
MADPDKLLDVESMTPERRAALAPQVAEARAAGHPEEVIAWALKQEAQNYSLGELCAARVANPRCLFLAVGGPESKTPDMTRTEVVIKRINPTLYGRWFREAGEPDSRQNANRNLVLNLLILPKRPAFLAILEDFPALADSFGNVALEAAGLVKAEQKKG